MNHWCTAVYVCVCVCFGQFQVHFNSNCVRCFNFNFLFDYEYLTMCLHFFSHLKCKNVNFKNELTHLRWQHGLAQQNQQQQQQQQPPQWQKHTKTVSERLKVFFIGSFELILNAIMNSITSASKPLKDKKGILVKCTFGFVSLFVPLCLECCHFLHFGFAWKTDWQQHITAFAATISIGDRY